MSRSIHALTEALSSRLANVVLRRPLVTLLLAILVTLAAAGGMPRLEFANNYRVFFSPQNPELVAFEDFQATYTKNDNIFFVLQPADGEAFTAEKAAAVEWLTAEARKIPYAIRVDSVTNFQHSWADGDDLTVEDLIRDADSLSDEQLAEKKDIALAEPLLARKLVSPDADTVGVNVTLQYPEESIDEVPTAVGFARGLADQLRAEHPDLTVALSGVSMLNNAFAEAGRQDAMSLVPFMYVVMLVVMVVALRSLWGTVATFAVISLSTVGALGLAGWVGHDLSPISVTAPTIILTLAIADSIHVLVTALGLLGEGRSKEEAIRESLRVNLLPVTLTSITTIVGFLALNFSDSPPFRHLGNLTAVGIAFAWALSLTVLPALMTLLPLRGRAPSARSGWIAGVLEATADLVTARPKLVLAGTAVVFVSLAAFLPRIQLNDEFVQYFDDRVQFRRDADFATANLSGVYIIEYSVPSGEPNGINDPEYLRRLEGFTGWLREQPEVMHVNSYADVIKRLNKNLHGDDEAWYRLPEETELAAQYLLLYELSLPYGLDLNDRIDIDKSATRVSATVHDISSVQIRAFLERASDWMAVHATGPDWAKPTGASVMFSYISQRNVESMLTGNLVAIGLIAIVIGVALGSAPFGFLSLLPNAAPVLMGFGIWGLLVGNVGMAAATVSATSLGIVVDDTVHLLTKYLRARREMGLEPADAVRYAFRTVGRALVTTTVVLAIGFSVLAFSTFLINSQMGLLTALTIVLALLVDLFLLPALLLARVSPQEVTTMKRVAVPAALMLAVFLLLPNAQAAEPPDGTPEGRGFAVAARSDRSDLGFADSRVDLRMVLRNAAGKETRRELTLTTLEKEDESVGDKSLIVFHEPADIVGTALLSHARILDADDQWLYLPALKRVKRISSVNKSGPFVGSEFAFEDFTALELGKFEYRWLREEPCGDLTCDVVERTPRYEHSGYTRQVTWVDQTDHQVRRVQFHDRRGDLLKTLTLSDYREYDGGFWRAHDLFMENHQTRKSTRLTYSDYTFGAGLAGGDFDKGALRRQR